MRYLMMYANFSYMLACRLAIFCFLWLILFTNLSFGQNFGNQQIIGFSNNGPKEVIAADIDGDGNKDALAVSFWNAKLNWYENVGSGSFSTKLVTNQIFFGNDVDVADVNGDNHQDIITASSNFIKVFLNNGSQQFSLQFSDGFSNSDAKNVKVIDIDQDGEEEIVASLNGPNEIVWYDKKGNQQWVKQTLIKSSDDISDLAIEDLNNDGKLDIIYASKNSNSVAWFKDTGQMSYKRKVISKKAGGANSIDIADFDSDQQKDIVSACVSDNKVVLYRNIGNANFTTQIVSNNISKAYDAEAGDLNQDNNIDIVAGSYNNDEIYYYQNTGSGNFIVDTITSNADGLTSISLSDMNGDDKEDILSASYNDFKIAWYENQHVATKPTTYDTLMPVACGSYTVPSGDETYTKSGTYQDTIANANGGDSVLTIYLGIAKSYDTLNKSAVNSYTVPSGDETYTTSGTYHDTIPGQSGCDSLLTIHVTIKPPSNPFADSLTALKFDGQDDYVSVDSIPSEIVGNSFSVSLWFKDSGSNKKMESLFSINTQSGGNRFLLYDSFVYPRQTGKNIPFNGHLYANEWNHIGVSYDHHHHLLKVYLNGQLDTGLSTSINIASTDKISFGQDWDKGKTTAHFSGKMDDIRIWDTALSQSGITDKFCQNLKYNQNNLVSYWNFNTGRGTLAKDVARAYITGKLKPTGQGPKWVTTQKNYCKGPTGNCLEFDGNDDYVSATSLPQGVTNGDFTISTWFKDLGPNQKKGPETLFAINTQSGGNRLLVYEDKVFDRQTNKNIHYNQQLKPNTWHQVTVTYNDQQKRLKVYLNGNLDTSYGTSITVASSDKVSLGQDWDGANTTAHFRGLMNEVKIWDEVRNPSQVKKDKCDFTSAGNNLVNHWSFDTKQKDSVYDVLGSVDGSLKPNPKNGPQWTFRVNDYCQNKPSGGKTNNPNALKFDGKDDYLSVDSFPFSQIKQKDFTISTWFKNLSPSGSNEEALLGFNTQAGKNRLLVYTNKVFNPSSGKNVAYNANLANNAWHNVTVSYSHAQDSVKIYLNGKLDTTLKVSLSFTHSDQFSIGQEWDNNKNTAHYSGLIDEVKVWDTLKPVQQIKAIDCDTLSPNSLLAYWHFNNGPNAYAEEMINQRKAYLKPSRRNGPQWVRDSFDRRDCSSNGSKNHYRQSCNHFVQKVAGFSQGLTVGKQNIKANRSNASSVLGQPSSQDFFSLGFYNQSFITLAFDSLMTGKLNIYETTWNSTNYLEKAGVYVSQDQTSWHYVGEATNQNNLKGDLHPYTFHLDSIRFKYVKVVNTTDSTQFGSNGDGFDLNAVCAEKKASGQKPVAGFCYDTLSKKACDQYTLPSGSRTINQNGTYYDTLSNANGCDSILTINLSFGDTSSSTINRTAYNSYTVPSGDETYTSNQTSSGFAFTLNGQLKSIKADSSQVINRKPTGVKAFGPGSVDFNGNSAVDVPVVKNQNQILLWDRVKGIHDTLDVSIAPVKTSKTLLNVGYWKGSGPSIFYADANSQSIFRVSPGNNPSLVTSTGNGIDGIYGITDFDGDGKNELVFADASQTVRYLNDNGVIQSTGVTVGSNNGLGLGTLADFNGDCKSSAPIVNGSNEIQLIGPNGVKTTILSGNTVEAIKAPIATLDVDNDNASEVVFQKDDAPFSGSLMYVDDVRGSNVPKFVNDHNGNKIQVDEERGVVRIGKPNSLGTGGCVGTVKDTLTNAAGCDSILTINLNLIPKKSKNLSSGCFTVKHLYNQSNPQKGTVTKRYRVINNCNKGWSNTAFELKPGTQALSHASEGNYPVENTTNNPFHSIKFECNKPDCFKNGASEWFQFTINAGDQISPMRVASKAGLNQGTVSFDSESDEEGDQSNTSGFTSTNTNEFSIYPNPVSFGDRSVTIQWQKPLEKATNIRIHNMKGEALKRDKVAKNSKQITLETDQLKKGIYLINVQGQGSQKIVVQ